MKIFKQIGVVAVIGFGLWASTVHAQNLKSRTAHLDCVPNTSFSCGAGGVKGELIIQRWEIGATNNQSGFIPSDGEPHPFFQLNVLLRCQDSNTGGELTGPRQFYVLYITPSSLATPIRIITFNPYCNSFRDRIAGRLPDIGNPDLWFTDELLVRVQLEADNDDFLHGNDSLSADVLAGTTCTVGCIVNGTFETGNLTGWTQSGINGGFANVVQEGTCFSFFNTTGLTFNGNFAANVRSSGPAPTSSIGILTSDLFVAGSGISFRALSENSDGTPAPDPVTLEVRVLDGAGSVLLSQIVTTNIVTLDDDFCPGGEPRDGIFSAHIVDTTAHAGTAVRVEFRQHTNVPGAGFFTLIDDVDVNP